MPRILFVKTSSLGDVVHNGPAVSDAARAIHGAEIDWVVEEAFADVPRMHRAVRHVIPVALRRWRSRMFDRAAWSEISDFRRRLAAERYDAVIDTQGLLKSALISRAAHGVRHGPDRASAREPVAARFYQATHEVPRTLHAVERNRLLAAAALGYSLDTQCDYGLAAPVAPEGSSYVVLLTMTSRADKLWPEERWIELGRALRTPAVLPWGSAVERERAGRIARGIGEAKVAEKMSLERLAGLLACASGVVGLDTGLTHLAAALGVPTVGIYCASDPDLTGLYGTAHARNVGGPGRPPPVAEVLKSLQ